MCEYLVENTAGRRWACSLYVEHGSWERVHADARYQRDVRPIVVGLVDVDCGDWPRPDERCNTCGQVGDD